MNDQKINTIGLMGAMFNPEYSHVIPLLTSPIEKFEEEFDNILETLRSDGENEKAEDLISKKESIRESLELMNKFQKIRNERKAQCSLSYYKEKLEENLLNQFSDEKEIALNAFIVSIKTYIEFVSRNISDGDSIAQVKLMERNLKTHLFDCINDVMAICNFENVTVPNDICDSLFNLHIEKDEEMDALLNCNDPSCGFGKEVDS